jgi:hypothetical protein
MKKILFKSFCVVCLLASLSSCATVFGGPITSSQKRAPYRGQPAREIRVGALIADVILFWPGTIVDFATGAIYKP